MHPKVREQDAHGAGYYKAPRGTRLHQGIDFDCPVDSLVTTITNGAVTKIGWVYSNPKKKEYRYVQVTDADGLKFRYMYLESMVKVGDDVTAKQIIGLVQDLTIIYPGITPHCHFEIMIGRKRIDPRFFALG